MASSGRPAREGLESACFREGVGGVEEVLLELGDQGKRVLHDGLEAGLRSSANSAPEAEIAISLSTMRRRAGARVAYSGTGAGPCIGQKAQILPQFGIEARHFRKHGVGGPARRECH